MLVQSQKQASYLMVGASLLMLLMLVFIKLDSDKKDVFLCEAVSTDPNLTMDQCPAHQESSTLPIFVAFGVNVIVLAIALYPLAVPAIKEEPQKFKKIDLSKLDPEEKTIYAILKQNNGSAYQSSLVKEAGFSKVRTTRLLDRLESKGIVERKRRGMTNLVVLK